ncbi:unnamed protein product [Owenia fusiformis]|uniref:Uncharacterized protein n=1 Tax=Owenia fusiformis TaxID=6347 RepID=A0A8J1Y248_OWEFU|nr:unnamed protein product [Owenia fusiformis]
MEILAEERNMTTEQPTLAACIYTHMTFMKVCYALWITMAIFGLIGNTVSVIVLSRKRLRLSTTATYLQALSISDMFVVLTAVFRYKAYYILLSEESYMEARFWLNGYVEVYIEPFHFIFLGASSLITTALTTERYMAISCPLSIKRHCDVIFTRVIIGAIYGIITIVTLPTFFTYNVISMNLDGQRITLTQATPFGLKTNYECIFHKLLIPIFWYIVPWLCIAVMNTLLLVHVKKSAKVSSRMLNFPLRSNRNLTVMLIGIVLVYMVCNLPKCVSVFMDLIQRELFKSCEIEVCVLPQSSRDLADTIASLLNTFNSCINFVLYCILGDKFFQECKRMFCGKCMKRSVRRVGFIETSVKRSRSNSKGPSVLQFQLKGREESSGTCIM